MFSTLAIADTVSWAIIFYAFSVFIAPMQQELGWSTPQVTGAKSLALVVVLGGVTISAPALVLHRKPKLCAYCRTMRRQTSPWRQHTSRVKQICWRYEVQCSGVQTSPEG